MKEVNEIQYRSITLDRESIGKEGERTVRGALSSEAPVRQNYGFGTVNEILRHDEDSINMERASEGLPLLWSHDRTDLIGRVVDISLDSDRVIRGTLKFSNSERATEKWNEVKDGFLRDLSLGYRVDEYREEQDDTVLVTRFTPLESSLVTVPADSRSGINRNHQESKMTDEVTKPEVADIETRQEEKSVGDELKLFTVQQRKEREVGAKLEATRRQAIRDLFEKYETRYGDTFSDLRRACEDSTEITVDRAKQAILDAIADGYVSVEVSARQDEGSSYRDLPKFGQGGRVPDGGDQWDKFDRAMELSLHVQAGNDITEEERKEVSGTEWYSMSVCDMARTYLRQIGERPTGDKAQVLGKALTRAPSHGTGHFASVLENVANKSLQTGFMDADESWDRWANTKSIPDFKATSLLNMSLFTDLTQVRDLQQYEYGDMSDLKETIQLLTYGKLFGISRTALINDDLSALSSVPRAMGAAANRKIGDVVYAVLTTGLTVTMLQDSIEIFDAATHANYVTSGAAPTVATLNAARVAMALQTDPQGKTIGLRMRHLIVPVALQTTAETLIAATYDPAGSAGTLPPNPFQGAVQVTADHRLDTFNSAGWFVASATNQVVVGFLNGQQTPYMESKDGWSIDGIEYKVRSDVAATAEDYRGLYYNDGVT